MTPVPCNPQPLDVLRGRYQAALEHLYDAVAICDQGAIRPGEVAANVFDFEDGLRLIVSREQMPFGPVVLHVSASFQKKCKIADEFRLLAVATPKEKILEMWVRDLPNRFRELSGSDKPLELIGVSDGNIPHFVQE